MEYSWAPSNGTNNNLRVPRVGRFCSGMTPTYHDTLCFLKNHAVQRPTVLETFVFRKITLRFPSPESRLLGNRCRTDTCCYITCGKHSGHLQTKELVLSTRYNTCFFAACHGPTSSSPSSS